MNYCKRHFDLASTHLLQIETAPRFANAICNTPNELNSELSTLEDAAWSS